MTSQPTIPELYFAAFPSATDRMGGSPSLTVTQLLVAWSHGDRTALEQLMPEVYAELRRQARRHLARMPSDTLQPTALVHEAFIKLIDQRSVTWQNRAHFFAIAARLMRRIVMNHVRDRHTIKRGRGSTHISVDDVEIPSEQHPVELLVLDDALGRLAAVDPLQSEIVELRFFGGLTIEEIAETLGLSSGTVKREWRTARAWLYKELEVGPS